MGRNCSENLSGKRLFLYFFIFCGCNLFRLCHSVKIEAEGENNVFITAGEIVVIDPTNTTASATHLLATLSALRTTVLNYQETLSSMQMAFQSQASSLQASFDSQVSSRASMIAAQYNTQLQSQQETLEFHQTCICTPQGRALFNISSITPIQFETARAVQVIHFEIDGVHYIAVSEQQNTTSNRVVNSHIYSFNGTDLTLTQSILTRGNYDMDVIFIDGDYYLAIAEFYDTYSRNGTTSDVWKWDRQTQKFMLYQNIPIIRWAEGVQFFVLGGSDAYLVIGGSPILLLKWNPVSRLFEPKQNFSSLTLYSVHNNSIHYYPYTLYRSSFSEIDGIPYLAFSAYGVAWANVCRYNSTTGLFDYFERFDGNRVRDIKFTVVPLALLSPDMAQSNSYLFQSVDRTITRNATYTNSSRSTTSAVVNASASSFGPAYPEPSSTFSSQSTIGAVFVVVANDGSSSSYISRWNGSSFQYYQDLPIAGAREVTPFSLGGSAYLSVASESGYGSSTVFVWNVAQQLFVPLESFSSVWPYTSYSTAYFSIGDRHFLALAAERSSTSFMTFSTIFEWNGCSFT